MATRIVDKKAGQFMLVTTALAKYIQYMYNLLLAERS